MALLAWEGKLSAAKGVAVTGVRAGSPAARAGLRAGDVLLAVNGQPIMDVLDYRFAVCAPKLSAAFRRGGRLHVRALPGGEPGLEFADGLMDEQRRCRNKCIFCFIDQLPAGLRDSLYFKDDDSRLSFLHGNYITLTNLTEHEVERIVRMRISPMRVSVHTTNPALRCRMMGNRHAGDALALLRRFADAGLRLECQLVLCPGYNDGAELDRSLADLAALMPALDSVAVVPVGLTAHREGLTPLRLFTVEEAAAVVRRVETAGGDMNARYGARIFHPADEFYIRAGMPLPPAEDYDEFSQLENGVGLMPLLEEEFSAALAACARPPRRGRILIATGAAAAPFLRGLIAAAREKWPELEAEVIAVANRFFGETIDVAGLVTGSDLTAALRGRAGDVLLLPHVMLRREGDLFLDGLSLADIEEALGLPVEVVRVDGYAFVDALTDDGER